METHKNNTGSRKSLLPKFLLIFSLSMLLGTEAYFGFRLHELSDQQERIKEDYADINNITYGLFSVQQWKDNVSRIVHHQVRNLKMTRKQKKILQTEVEQVLLALINKAEALVNKPKKTLSGKIQKFAIRNFVNSDSIRAQVPGFARKIIAEVDNPKNKRQLSKMAMGEFNELADEEKFDSAFVANGASVKAMYRKYQVSSTGLLNKKLSASLADIRTKTYGYSFGMLACVVVVLGFWWGLRKRRDLHVTLFVMSLLFAFILLFVGLTASMIEVDARIRSLDFVLLGEHVVFKDQVLFFQSKSIMDVVRVLISQPGIDSILVGVLILVFSILFPVVKLSSTGVHLLGNKRLAENGIIKYFAFQSGKWSMADVIVIAILMAYIGLNGLLEGQLQALNIKNDSLTILTTNNTALQPGYIIFISFVLYGLILSTILKFITPHDAH
ncbi:paraquat-inducible protein A [Pedobacter ginsenosidimutans]|uniref:Paraquat-inducible protein A n=1 Tax=Pedobacter ginsenosidimutans TaxID=687842 RepID=A0A0T5VRK1_9SPHI|nr:paraquat-inducible protein A [Pedobacter ginsenosidimutans]KRT15813.1 paraquat-inducible protein A [Pedobacter ginsenosidimutans]